MKKIFVLLILVFCLFNIVSTRAYSKVNSLENVMSYSNSNIVKKEVLGYGRFSSNQHNKEILVSFLKDNFMDKTFNISESNESVSATHQCPYDSITINISSGKTSKTEKYISIFYSHNAPNENIINLRETIRQMILPFDKDCKLSSHIVGKLNTKLSKAEISSLISFMLTESSIKFNKDYEDSSVSFSGYTDNLQESIKVSGEDINIQASGRYSTSDKCTYIWVGSPIISTEY